eukprot:CAMPEP_0178869800 /NCGR_PEP_ID=MMETSP0747-20121128/6730_1 /TAXON_ID=913974 /ORGANISM="Nitzschia punctata, Strain CCMP561" /LENGTH=1277 /DNA_ID=CAMNT_0020536865 /DNA_START=151 /DNA_END=3984 /DNA_ORIENTATION=+
MSGKETTSPPPVTGPPPPEDTRFADTNGNNNNSERRHFSFIRRATKEFGRTNDSNKSDDNSNNTTEAADGHSGTAGANKSSPTPHRPWHFKSKNQRLLSKYLPRRPHLNLSRKRKADQVDAEKEPVPSHPATTAAAASADTVSKTDDSDGTSLFAKRPKMHGNASSTSPASSGEVIDLCDDDSDAEEQPQKGGDDEQTKKRKRAARNEEVEDKFRQDLQEAIARSMSPILKAKSSSEKTKNVTKTSTDNTHDFASERKHHRHLEEGNDDEESKPAAKQVRVTAASGSEVAMTSSLGSDGCTDKSSSSNKKKDYDGPFDRVKAIESVMKEIGAVPMGYGKPIVYNSKPMDKEDPQKTSSMSKEAEQQHSERGRTATDAAVFGSGETMKMTDMQQRLVLLRHAAKCTHEDEHCPDDPHCDDTKQLWKHMYGCKDNECTVLNCVSSRYVLNHYRKCKDTNCPTCEPVRSYATHKTGRMAAGNTSTITELEVEQVPPTSCVGTITSSKKIEVSAPDEDSEEKTENEVFAWSGKFLIVNKDTTKPREAEDGGVKDTSVPRDVFPVEDAEKSLLPGDLKASSETADLPVARNVAEETAADCKDETKNTGDDRCQNLGNTGEKDQNSLRDHERGKEEDGVGEKFDEKNDAKDSEEEGDCKEQQPKEEDMAEVDDEEDEAAEESNDDDDDDEDNGDDNDNDDNDDDDDDDDEPEDDESSTDWPLVVVSDDTSNELIEVTTDKLILVALPLCFLAAVFWWLDLVVVSNSIFTGCLRTFFQLSSLGTFLAPIFKLGMDKPLVVLGYALFMVILASYEASSRTKYVYDGQFYHILVSLTFNMVWVVFFAFGFILKPKPLWNPRYFLPIVGMLIGNSINGISLSIDSITTSLVEDQSEIELYLSFGASKYEAIARIFTQAVQKGATPVLNMMRVVGIISIPGMMTGQLISGSPVMLAARYQMMIIFLIATSTLSTILLSSFFAVDSAFCPHQLLRPERFVKNHKRTLFSSLLWVWGAVFGGQERMGVGNVGIAKPDLSAVESLPPASSSRLQIWSLRESGMDTSPLLEASGLGRSFVGVGDVPQHRVLFEDVSVTVNDGDMFIVNGRSGVGKTEFFRLLAGLSPLQEGNIQFFGKDWNVHYHGSKAADWRKQVLYVTQHKVQIPGTPRQFIGKVASFQSWREDSEKGDKVRGMIHRASKYMLEWGLHPSDLDKDWKTLSGGEAQRILIAVALASRPKVLLFDECTSALDKASKVLVEQSVIEHLENHGGGMLWISHDEQQAQRMLNIEP